MLMREKLTKKISLGKYLLPPLPPYLSVTTRAQLSPLLYMLANYERSFVELL